MSKVLWLLVFAGLLLLDQGSKALALHYAPTIETAWHSIMAYGCWLDVGLLMHEPDTETMSVIALSMASMALCWTARLPILTLVLWTTAGLSNHVEMLVRPGVVDFLVVKSGDDAVTAFNLADVYVYAGLLVLVVSLVLRKTYWYDMLWFSRFVDYSGIQGKDDSRNS